MCQKSFRWFSKSIKTKEELKIKKQNLHFDLIQNENDNKRMDKSTNYTHKHQKTHIFIGMYDTLYKQHNKTVYHFWQYETTEQLKPPSHLQLRYFPFFSNLSPSRTPDVGVSQTCP